MYSRSTYSKRRRSRKVGVPGRLHDVRRSTGSYIPLVSTAPSMKVVRVFPTDQGASLAIAGNNTNPITDIGTAPNCVVLNSIPLAAGTASRQGTRIRLRTLLLSAEFFSGTNGAAPHFHARLALVYDKRPTGSTPGLPPWNLIYENDSITGFRATGGRDRFEVLYEQDIKLDKSVVWNGTTAFFTYGPSSSKVINVRIPIYRVTSFAEGNVSGSYAAMTSGALILMLLSPDVPNASNNMQMGYNFKLSFDDLTV